MLDLLFVVLTFVCFGAAHLYGKGCDRLKVSAHHD